MNCPLNIVVALLFVRWTSFAATGGGGEYFNSDLLLQSNQPAPFLAYGAAQVATYFGNFDVNAFSALMRVKLANEAVASGISFDPTSFLVIEYCPMIPSEYEASNWFSQRCFDLSWMTEDPSAIPSYTLLPSNTFVLFTYVGASSVNVFALQHSGTGGLGLANVSTGTNPYPMLATAIFQNPTGLLSAIVAAVTGNTIFAGIVVILIAAAVIGACIFCCMWRRKVSSEERRRKVAARMAAAGDGAVSYAGDREVMAEMSTVPRPGWTGTSTQIDEAQAPIPVPVGVARPAAANVPVQPTDLFREQVHEDPPRKDAPSPVPEQREPSPGAGEPSPAVNRAQTAGLPWAAAAVAQPLSLFGGPEGGDRDDDHIFEI